MYILIWYREQGVREEGCLMSAGWFVLQIDFGPMGSLFLLLFFYCANQFFCCMFAHIDKNLMLCVHFARNLTTLDETP